MNRKTIRPPVNQQRKKCSDLKRRMWKSISLTDNGYNFEPADWDKLNRVIEEAERELQKAKATA